MSYRGIKRALGETNLERKCRWLFGACLLPLIMGSFWFYGWKTDQIVYERNRFIGEALANAALIEAHLKKQEESAAIQRVDEIIAANLRRKQYTWEALHPKNEQDIGKPTDIYEWELMDRWVAMGEELKSRELIEEIDPQWDQREIKKPSMRDDDTLNDEERLVYQYYEPVFAAEICIFCHSSVPAPVAKPNLKPGDLMAVMRVEFDAQEIQEAKAENTAWLLVAAIATVFLAMLVLYMVVRYIIVKPLRHLRDVSDLVRRGDVEQRAALKTGDEFEDLGAAFNRMLRQLLRQQDELREVNGELDEKIDEMAQANMRLFEMNQLKSDFLATVSHELRTPLNSIIGFSDLLGSADKMEDTQKRYAGNIQRSGRQLLEMINDILDLAKIESGKMDLKLSDFHIGSVVSAQCDMARPLSEKKNLDLVCESTPGLPIMTQDKGKIEQILNNLLSNAIKFTPEGGRISVKAHRDRRGDLRLSVADTGVGINESEQVLVFEKFRQGTTVLAGGNAMTREYSGTGLGLSIVRELCRLLGGDITLESELGKGSEFTVLLPWALTEQPKIESPLADELDQLAKHRPEMPSIAANTDD